MRQISTVIEIGTSKIVCIISQRGQFDESHILGSAVKSYAGYKNKKWLDKKNITPAIIGAIHEAEQQAGKKCKYVHIGIPADFTKVVCSSENIDFSGYRSHISSNSFFPSPKKKIYSASGCFSIT